ncbi:hypothetical protein Sulku_2422 [Sulfuricurvum kujiense DSM 16994]|uniref:DUF4145 domain-containing protein n=1 Tax=Sulfuricurvum kujiense (strain ATCC BAA-921 / DSM 16994 / JCM 11577 / YK-1) TaxID=709032 RepID=E4TYD7_SULKY|nr:hypothetical protein [Sulfuricurvum kujiense]ADR35082.1 hypothetical protein Sulku_2422 [Sulfuricurvum kujiense DSM 16994]
MEPKYASLKKELKALMRQGDLLYYAMADEQGQLSEEAKSVLKEKGIELPRFNMAYDPWYSEALLVVKQIIPDRYDDFVKQYKNDKRKEIDFLTYGISDYLVGLKTTRGGGMVVADQSAAIPKMQNQNSILASAEKRFESTLFDIQEVLQADIYDSELEAARELAKKGFVRGGGAIAGVVLEKHLGHVCAHHALNSRKKHPSIADFYELLKENNIIDTAKWRFIQHLGDLRNLCDHNKEREPTKDDVFELVEGVEKVIKTVF